MYVKQYLYTANFHNTVSIGSPIFKGWFTYACSFHLMTAVSGDDLHVWIGNHR